MIRSLNVFVLKLHRHYVLGLHQFKPLSYGKFGYLGPYSDRKMPAKGLCVAKKSER